MTAVRSGNFSGARAMLDRARSLAGDDPDALARIAVSDAYVEAELHGFEAGISICAAVTRTSGLSAMTQGMAWSQMGLLYMRRGDREEALSAFSTAIPLLEGDDALLGRALLNRGTVHLYRSHPHAAAPDLVKAREHLARAGLDETMGKAEHNLGYIQLLLGDLISALHHMDLAMDAMMPLTDVLRSVLFQDRAEVLLAAGRIREAAEALDSAAAAYGSQRLRRFQAECEFVLARTLMHSEPHRARSVARRAARRFSDHDSPVWAARAEALALIAGVTLGARDRRLREQADGLHAQLIRDGHHRDAEQLALHVVRLVIRRGDFDDAAARLRKTRITDDTPIGTRLLAREVKAELARARGQARIAREHVRQGLADLHAWQASFGSLDLQSTMVGHGNALARLGLELALEDGRPDVVFEWSERARALASKVTSLRPPPDPQLAADLTELRLLDPKETTKARELRERIRSKTWYAAEGSVGEPATLDALKLRLADHGAALVAHIVLDDQLTALVVTAEDTHVVPLDGAARVRDQLDRIAADLDFAAHNPGGSFGETVRASLEEDLAAVADELVTPLLDLVGDRRVVLTPSALLAGTPWTLLPGLRGRPLTVPTSATRWLELMETRPGKPKRIGLVAGPRVDRAAEEVDLAAAEWKSADVLHGDDANAAKVAEVAGRVDVLHLAGHGVHAGDHPLFSAVELADGPWFGHDIDLLPQTPSVVVLSACELGQVSVLRGEETVGMTAAWLHAGARTVLSSPALVADAVACDALAHWHRLVAAGAAPADALAEVVASADGVVPFQCFGAGW
ncbi:tetratricopeptide (TPR) repeat protein [Marmoricola sp. URHA0025 HA25]